MIKTLQLLFIATQVLLTFALYAQNAGLNDDNSDPHNSAQLDIKSTSRGLLIPRMTMAQRDAIAGPAESLLVFQTDNDPGYYYYSGSTWIRIGSESQSIITASSNTTLAKEDQLVLASNDITLTLPAITNADDGLMITVKNVGTYLDLIVIKPQEAMTIDGLDSCQLTRWRSKTYIALNSNWIIKEREIGADHFMDVSEHSSWQTIGEVMEYLEEHMAFPVVIRLGAGEFQVSSTHVIDLPYPVTIQSLSFGATTIVPGPGLSGKPMFRCFSECYFKMLTFDGSALAGYGENTGEDAIRLLGPSTYNEIKDSFFNQFNNAVLDSTNAELWMFECDISNCSGSGLLVHSPDDSVKMRISETDFIQCRNGINLSKGADAIIQITLGVFMNEFATDTGIVYRPPEFSFETMIITGNSFNNHGKFIEGFDFSRPDGRDANAYLIGNAGEEDKIAHGKITLLNNPTNTVSRINYTKVDWNTSTTYCKTLASKITIGTTGTAPGNRITYQPINKCDFVMWISGNVANASSSTARTINIGICQNGNTTIRYGETSVRVAAQQAYTQFITVVYLEDVQMGDYFELFFNATTGSDSFNFSDMNWYTESH